MTAKAKSATQRLPFQFTLDLRSGVPVYRQLIDQVRLAVASGSLAPGDQLPTVRQVAVDLTINPNTVVRAYRELELGGALDTQQGTGTFISQKKINPNDSERQRQLALIASEVAARAGGAGFTIQELIEQLREFVSQSAPRR